jgi:hypothetical protein
MQSTSRIIGPKKDLIPALIIFLLFSGPPATGRAPTKSIFQVIRCINEVFKVFANNRMPAIYLSVCSS